MASKRTSKKQKKSDCNYVMFGYNKHDKLDVGYLSEDLKICNDIQDAKLFFAKKKPKQKGFGTPEQWLAFVNDDADINNGFVFHLVATSRLQ